MGLFFFSVFIPKTVVTVRVKYNHED